MTDQLRHVTSTDRVLSQRDLAAMRPAKPPVPRGRKPSPLREVTNGIVCFCGQQFGETQALEFMLHLRAEVGATLSWVEHKKSQIREKSRRRLANPETRERLNAQFRERYKDPDYRERYNARARERHRLRAEEDPEYVAKKKARARENYRQRAARRAEDGK